MSVAICATASPLRRRLPRRCAPRNDIACQSYIFAFLTLHLEFGTNHDLYRRFGPRKPRPRGLRRGAPLGASPQGAVAGLPADDQQPHGADGRVRGARNPQIRGLGGRDLLRFEIRRRCRHQGLGLRLGAQGIRGQEKPRPVDALPARVQPPQRSSGSRVTPTRWRTTAATSWLWRRPTTGRTGWKIRDTIPRSGDGNVAALFFCSFGRKHSPKFPASLPLPDHRFRPRSRCGRHTPDRAARSPVLVLSILFRIFGCAEDTSARHNASKLAFALAYSYLCPIIA